MVRRLPVAIRPVIQWEYGWRIDAKGREYLFAKMVCDKRNLYSTRRTVTDKKTAEQVQREVLDYMDLKTWEFNGMMAIY